MHVDPIEHCNSECTHSPEFDHIQTIWKNKIWQEIHIMSHDVHDTLGLYPFCLIPFRLIPFRLTEGAGVPFRLIFWIRRNGMTPHVTCWQ